MDSRRYQIYDINIFFHSMGCLFFLLISVLSLSLFKLCIFFSFYKGNKCIKFKKSNGVMQKPVGIYFFLYTPNSCSPDKHFLITLVISS